MVAELRAAKASAQWPERSPVRNNTEHTWMQSGTEETGESRNAMKDLVLFTVYRHKPLNLYTALRLKAKGERPSKASEKMVSPQRSTKLSDPTVKSNQPPTGMAHAVCSLQSTL